MLEIDGNKCSVKVNGIGLTLKEAGLSVSLDYRSLSLNPYSRNVSDLRFR